MTSTSAPRKRGRPPGPSVGKRTGDKAGVVPTAAEEIGDFRHADPDTIIARQLTMLDWAQQAIRNEMHRRLRIEGAEKVSVDVEEVERLEKLSNAIVRAIDALKKSSDLADELSRRLTPEQLLEAALKKVEGQDVATLRYAIKRLRAYLEKLSPLSNADRMSLGEVGKASAAIAALVDE